MTKFCPKCGDKLEGSAKFCDKCGHKTVESKAAKNPPKAKPARAHAASAAPLGLSTGMWVVIIVLIVGAVIAVSLIALWAMGTFDYSYDYYDYDDWDYDDWNGGDGNGGTGTTVDIQGLLSSSGRVITSGSSTTEKIQTIFGTVEDPDTSTSYFDGDVVLTFNGQDRYLDVWNDGTNGDSSAYDDIFTYKGDLVLDSGTNTFRIKVLNDYGSVIDTTDTVTIYASVPTRDIKVVLTWNTDLNDLDMHVYDPDGYHAWYSDLDGIPGGDLDLDDVDGYGPETFTQDDSSYGTYTVKVRYYDDHGQSSSSTATVRVTLNEGSTQTYTHTFYQSEANYDDSSNDWTVTTFST